MALKKQAGRGGGAYEGQHAPERAPAMQAALDKRAARLLCAHKARINGEMDEAVSKFTGLTPLQ